MNHESELLERLERRYTKRAEILKKHLPDENVPDMIFFSQQECYELMVKKEKYKRAKRKSQQEVNHEA